MHGVAVFFALRQGFIDDLVKGGRVDSRKPGITINLGGHRRDVQGIGQADRLTVDLATANHADFVDTEINSQPACFTKRRVQRLNDNGSLRREKCVAANDDARDGPEAAGRSMPRSFGP
jgi:hypothetical protein